MKKNSKIYIAGHTGLVGRAMVRALTKADFTNLILKTRVELDLLNQKAVHDFFESEQPEYVILSAAKVGGIKVNVAQPADFLFENLVMQNNVIGAAWQNNVKKLLFLGSSCIYPRDSDQPMKEEYFLDGKVEPTNEGYALAKIAGLKLCEKIFDQYQRTFISCMPTNIYGQYDNFSLEGGHVIPALMRRMHEAKINNLREVIIWGSGRARREFLHVDDLAQAIIWLMENYNDRDFLNIGTGEDITIRDLAFLVKEVVGYRGELVFDGTKPDGMPRKLLDISKIKSLGWQPKTSLEEGLKTTYDWYQKSKIYSD